MPRTLTNGQLASKTVRSMVMKEESCTPKFRKMFQKAGVERLQYWRKNWIKRQAGKHAAGILVSIVYIIPDTKKGYVQMMIKGAFEILPYGTSVFEAEKYR